MPDKKNATLHEILRRLGWVVLAFLASAEKKKAWALLALLLVSMLAIIGMNVVNNYVIRDFFSAIERKDYASFLRYAWLYFGVFALSTVLAAFFRFFEERLALLWRSWQTHHVVEAYLRRHVYFHLKETGAITNPDQRISEDIRAMTTTTLSFLLMILNGTFTAISFSSVLWSISPPLFTVAVLYAAAGSGLTILLGRPLIKFNYQQADLEADFRSELIRVHRNAAGLAFTRDEERIKNRLSGRIASLILNFRKIIAVNRNLNFFTSGYNYMIQLIPVLFIAPMFMQGEVEFGVIGQSAMAFATLVGAFSLVVTQFQSISSYASVVTRLSELVDATGKATARDVKSCPDCRLNHERIVYRKLNLRASEEDDRIVLRDLDATFELRHIVHISGPNPEAKQALFRVTAGLHEFGSGSMELPPADKLVFVMEKPYLSIGSLREILTPTGSPPVSDDEMHAVFDELGIDAANVCGGDFDTPRPWSEALSLSESQLLAVARALLAQPAFIFLDHLDSSLDSAQYRLIREVIAKRGIAGIFFGNGDHGDGKYDALLEFNADGSWKWSLPG